MGKHEGRDHLEDPDVDWEDNIKMFLQEIEWGTWIGLIWLWIWTDGGQVS
jgi:hypothetical protein